MTRTTDDMIDRVAHELEATLMAKNRSYGDAYAQNGLDGIAIELMGKFWRIRELVLKYRAVDKEAVRDAFMDLAGYGLLGLILCDHPEIQLSETELHQLFVKSAKHTLSEACEACGGGLCEFFDRGGD